MDRLVFGTGRLDNGDLHRAAATLRRACDLGIRRFDSAIGYGNGTAQAVLGSLVRSLPKGAVEVSTKIGHVATEPAGFRRIYRSEEGLWAMVHECRRMLGQIALLQIHEADNGCWWHDTPDAGQGVFVKSLRPSDIADAPVMAVLERAKREGVAARVGITGNSSRALAAVTQAIADSSGDGSAAHAAAAPARRQLIDSVMCAYNLDPVFRGTLRAILPVARAAGAEVLAAGFLQGGVYRSPLELPEHYARVPGLTERMATFDRIRRESGLSGVELVLRWALTVSDVDRWVLGASRPEQVEQTMNILHRGPLTDDLRTALDELALPELDWAQLWDF